jgi:hypothetical protein
MGQQLARLRQQGHSGRPGIGQSYCAQAGAQVLGAHRCKELVDAIHRETNWDPAKF